MKLSQVCNILKAKIPQYTNEFSINIQDCTISSSVSDVEVIVSLSSHGLSVNDDFTLSNIYVGNEVPDVSTDILNYRHVVTRVIDSDTFAFEIEQAFVSFTDITAKIHTSIRIYVAVSIEVAIQAYTKTSDLTLVLIDLPLTVSRDRKSKTDANQTTSLRNAPNLYLINNIESMLFIPLKNQTVGSEAIDKTKDILSYLIKSLVGVQLQSDFETQIGTQITLDSAGVEQVGNSTLVYGYNFESVETVTIDDMNTDSKDFTAGLDEFPIFKPVLT